MQTLMTMKICEIAILVQKQFVDRNSGMHAGHS